MAMEFPLSDFCIIKLSFLDSDFNDEWFSIAIINKDDYLQKMRNILSDSSKFSEISSKLIIKKLERIWAAKS